MTIIEWRSGSGDLTNNRSIILPIYSCIIIICHGMQLTFSIQLHVPLFFVCFNLINFRHSDIPLWNSTKILPYSNLCSWFSAYPTEWKYRGIKFSDMVKIGKFCIAKFLLFNFDYKRHHWRKISMHLITKPDLNSFYLLPLPK